MRDCKCSIFFSTQPWNMQSLLEALQIHTHTHIYTHTYIHTYIHTHTHTQAALFLELLRWGNWRDGSAVKCASCSSWGLKFSFPEHQITHNCLSLQLQGKRHPLLAPVCTCEYTHIHINKEKKSKMELGIWVHACDLNHLEGCGEKTLSLKPA